MPMTSSERSRLYRGRHPGRVNEASARWRDRNPILSWAQTTLSFHRKKFDVRITGEELAEFAKDKLICPYCEAPFDWTVNRKFGRSGPKENSPTLDRKNNDQIIDLSTIEIVCHRCNACKQNFTKKEFIEYCASIARKFIGGF